ncbi:MAG: putative RNA uridine N3 methyltransferase [Promethearchaeota archaeon]
MLHTIAIPDSSVIDCSDLRSKTEKIFQFARIAAIFKIQDILIYHDPFLKPSQANKERRIVTRILQYIECPQYLRKRLFPLSRDTSAVGVLSPLATPHHTRSKELKPNEIREAAIFINQKRIVADVGGPQLLEVISSLKMSLMNKTIRVTTKIYKTEEGFKANILPRPPKSLYWGFKVHSSATTIGKFLINRSEFKIATSKSCQPISSISTDIKNKANLLVAFGGPYQGIPEMLKAEGKKVSDVFNCCYNILQNFGTRSLRLEEAMMITLSKLEDRLSYR